MLTVATWNLENFFPAGTPFGPDTQSVFDHKVQLLAATIRSSGADVVATQEVGDPAALDALLTELGPGWTGELSTHFEAAHPIRVGFLTRLPVVETEQYSDIPARLHGVPTGDDGARLTAMGRGALRLRVTTGAGDADLVSVHLKSKLLSFPGGGFQPHDEDERARYAAYALLRRAAEAAAVRTFADALLDGHGAERRLFVMGDFNDGVEAATTQIVNGPPGSEIGTSGETQPDRGDGWRLLNLAPLIPPEKRFSRVFRGTGELIDHIFVSTALRPAVQSVTTIPGASALPSITENATARKDAPVSDHAMVAAVLTL
ncbi:endonuclease/exonuclease/phosphatase family protein [uncultured Leifsonia sp.]|uniref:endonuclease/exonuclease/phosphatase family protein n=1 Tax=uncultured Leifsonia sp. TaxID=340359 RepID=UPI0028D76986|nr:endonuclease/exonuclease/phosphatase family protein [uncultured Leifsonia sp.]